MKIFLIPVVFFAIIEKNIHAPVSIRLLENTKPKLSLGLTMQLRKMFVVVAMCLIIASCAPSPEVLQKAVSATQAGWTPVPTQTAYPTYTAFPTYTVYPTYTLSIPTSTPMPTVTPTPSFTVQTKQIGPINDILSESSYTMEITVKDTKWLRQDGYKEAKDGKTFVIVYLDVKNLGPGAVKSFGASNFQTLDANGILSDYELVDSTDQCQMELVDLMPNGFLQGCIAFEVPLEGKVEFVYAPYQYEGLKEGRYISFPLR